MKKVKKILKYFFSILAVLLFLLSFFVFLALKSNSFQTYLTQKIGNYLSDKTGSTITVQKVEFEWIKTLVLRDVLILDHHKDTLLFGGKLSLGVKSYSIENKDFSIGKLALENTFINLQKYIGEDSTNLQYFISRLKIKKKQKNSDDIEVKLQKLTLENVKFRYWNQNKNIKNYGVDYSHLHCSSIFGDLENVSYQNDSVTALINHLSLKERSGFALINLKGSALICETELTINDMFLQSKNTKLLGKLSFKYEKYADFKNFAKKVNIQCDFKPSKIHARDLSYFVPALKGLNDSINLEGKISGKVSRLKLKNLSLRYGALTYFKGEVTFDGLPDIQNTFIYINVKDFVTIENDILNIPLPPFTEKKRIKTPKWFSNLGVVSFSGKYTGFINDFVAYGNFETSCGTVVTDIKFNKNEQKTISISGSINAQQFDLGNLIQQKKLGKVTFIGSLNSEIKQDVFEANIKGKLPRLDLNTYSYSGITVDGKLTNTEFIGNLSVKDSNLIMDFNGGVDFSKKLHRYNFTASVQKANLNQLNWLKRDSSSTVSFNMNINLEGNQMDDIHGSLTLNDFNWSEKGKNYHLNSAIINSVKSANKELISINSDWLTARIEGNYYLKELYPSLLNIISRDLPSLVKWKYSQSAFKGKNDFRLMFKINDYALIHDVFTPKINFKNAQFSGAFNDKTQQFQMNFYADTFDVKGYKIDGIKLNANNKQDQVNVFLSSNFIHFNDSLGLQGFHLDALSSNNNNINYNFLWDNPGLKKNSGNIAGKMNIKNLDSVWTQITNMNLVLQDKLWQVNSNNSLVFSPNNVNFYNFSASSNQQEIKVDGLLSKNEKSNLSILTNNFNLENFSAYFQRIKTDIKGSVSGDVIIQGEISNPIIKSDLQIDSFAVNKQMFGKVKSKTNYFFKEGRMSLDLSVENKSLVMEGNTFVLKGNYYPLKNGELDLEANLSNLRIQFLEKYFQGVFSDFKRGKISGNLKVKGTIKEPEIYGKVRLDQMNLKVNYLNVEYAINAQNVYFNNNLIQFKNFEIRHNKYEKSLAVVNGYVQHKAFKNFTYSMDSIRLSNVFCLNTTIDENSSYYGTAFANGLLKMKGNGKKNSISGTISSTAYQDKLAKGTTQLNLPLSEIGELKSSDFIEFVNLKELEKKGLIKDENIDLSGLEMDLNFIVNPDATVKIIFDPRVGDEVEANGSGNINMKINSEGKFLMSGNYEIEQGKYFFTLKNFIGKRFIVEKGGTISWDGDPLAAIININTYYQSRAKLIDLANESDLERHPDWTEQFSNRIPVNANILMTGNLLQPAINMSVTLPNATVQEQEFLSTTLIGEDEINRQVFAVLLTNQFLPTTTGTLLGAVSIMVCSFWKGN